MPSRPLAMLMGALFAAIALTADGASADGDALATSRVEIPPTQGMIVGEDAHSYEAPWMGSRAIERLPEGRTVTIAGTALGENWIVGDQTWPMAIQDWGNVWYVLADGSYVYSAFVFVPRPGEVSPWADPQNTDRYVVVDLSDQLAWAMIGPDVAHQMRVTTGRGVFATPAGEWYVGARVANERMTSRGAGITDPREYYDVQRVLFTQYFTGGGHALHLNYWQPYEVFGGYASSHGCVGLLLHDAQWLWLFAQPGMPVIVRE